MVAHATPGTPRLYLDDPSLLDFEATVVGHAIVEGRPALVLDRTGFYPDSGGQPGDTGGLGGLAVEDTRADVAGTPVVIDVRSAAEYAGGHVAGSLSIPLPHLEERIAEVPADRPLAVHCEGGYRSAIAASLLQKLGRRDVHDMVGGYKAWLAAKLPTATGSAAAPA